MKYAPIEPIYIIICNRLAVALSKSVGDYNSIKHFKGYRVYFSKDQETTIGKFSITGSSVPDEKDLIRGNALISHPDYKDLSEYIKPNNYE